MIDDCEYTETPTVVDGITIMWGSFRGCFTYCAPRQLDGLDPELRRKLLKYTYASKDDPRMRYVRGDTFLRDYPEFGSPFSRPLTRRSANDLANAFLQVAYGSGAHRINTISLDVSPQNVLTGMVES